MFWFDNMPQLLCDRPIHSGNKHLISACVGAACNIKINQMEAWVKGEELQTAAEVQSYFLTYERFRVAEVQVFTCHDSPA